MIRTVPEQVADHSIVLSADSVCIRPGAPSISVRIRHGEIVGIAGLEGHGQADFLQVLCGIQRPLSGVVRAEGPRTSTVIRDIHGAVRARVAYLPRDRATQGILPSLSILDNFSIAAISRFARYGVLQMGRQLASYEQFRRRLSIVASSARAPITSLSGGNQQKVLIARCLATNPLVLVLDDPTRGVDLGTRLSLYDTFRAMAAEGLALVLLSTEVEEFLRVCDRVLVFREGHVFAELPREMMSMSSIIAAMFGRIHAD
jgi:ribose transport system ATP-binding protein